MIAATPTGRDVLEQLSAVGYETKLEGGKLMARGPVPLTDDLRSLVRDRSGAVKAALLLDDPPEWLEKLFELWWNGTETPVRLSGPSGGAEVYMVSVTVKNICAAVAAAVGMDPLQWAEIREEVEEALGREGAA